MNTGGAGYMSNVPAGTIGGFYTADPSQGPPYYNILCSIRSKPAIAPAPTMPFILTVPRMAAPSTVQEQTLTPISTGFRARMSSEIRLLPQRVSNPRSYSMRRPAKPDGQHRHGLAQPYPRGGSERHRQFGLQHSHQCNATGSTFLQSGWAAITEILRIRSCCNGWQTIQAGISSITLRCIRLAPPNLLASTIPISRRASSSIRLPRRSLARRSWRSRPRSCD